MGRLRRSGRDAQNRAGTLQFQQKLAHCRPSARPKPTRVGVPSSCRTARPQASCGERKNADTISQWIFPDPLQPEEPVNPGSAYLRHEDAAPAGTGLPSIRFHDLRHTFATHALTSGVDAKTLSGILGHTNASLHAGHLHPCHRRICRRQRGEHRGRLHGGHLRKGVETVARKRKARRRNRKTAQGWAVGGPHRHRLR
ncbi:MAG: tyrosine-type recombinase/integrase [Dysosmobacter sp.]